MVAQPKQDRTPRLSIIPKEDFTDLGNARLFAKAYAGKVKYVHGRDQWLIWDGKRWKPDSKMQIVRYGKLFVKELYRRGGEPGDAGFSEKMVKWAISSSSKTRIDAMLSLARSEEELAIDQEELDGNEWLLNCANGTLDLRTSRVHSHNPDDLITKLVNVDYKPGAFSRVWLDFLTTIFDNDIDLMNYVQRAIGYSVTGVIAEQVIFFGHGGGANGKSTFYETLGEIFTEYTVRLRAESLMVRDRNTIPADLATLAGARFCIADENDADQRWSENTVKSLTGDDLITARFMRKDFFTFKPTHHLHAIGNHRPNVRGTDEGMWRRMKLIPFNVTIAPEKRDTRLREKLRAEFEGILAWAIAGTASWLQQGLRSCAAVDEATAEYRAEMDTIAEFISECLEPYENARINDDDLYSLYENMMKRNGERAMSKVRLTTILKERGFEKIRSNSKAYWINWRQKTLVNNIDP